MTLKDKTFSGFKWSFIDSFSKYFLTFFIGIILARLLSPSDYGIIGMTTIFISLSRVFIDGGFSDALIRKLEPTVEDYSSVFIFNVILACFFYIILFVIAPSISTFFNEPKLILLIRVIGISLLIGAMSSIQIVILRKNLNFKLLAVVGFISTIVSGIVSISMAYSGFGVWSLVYSGIIAGFTSSVSLWFLSKWKPKLIFSLKIIRGHFKFGSKIMLGSFVNVIYDNMYYVLIGKLFSPAELGFYSKADGFQKLPASNIDIIVRQVTYPVLASLQREPSRLKDIYQKMIRVTSFLVFIMLFGLAVVAKSFVITLIGEKWLPSVPYLQLLCLVGAFYPLISINCNVLNVKGRSDLSLLITIIKVLLSIPALFLGYYLGIFEMILGMIGASLCIYMLVLIFNNYTIGYSIKEQLADIGQSLIFGLIVILPAFLVGKIISFTAPLVLALQLFASLLMYFMAGELLRNSEYFLIKELMISRLKAKNKQN